MRRLAILSDALAANTARPGLMLDANESWQVKQAVRYVSALEQHVDLLWVEEPLRRWDAVGHARLSTAIRAAVATGENLTGVEQFRSLFEAGAPDVVQAGAVWGVAHVHRLALASAARDLPISPVGYNANPAVAHVMTAVPNHLTTELQAFEFADGVLVDHEFADGGIVLGDEPGSGITIDEVAIEGARRGDGWRSPGSPITGRAGSARRARRGRALMEIRNGTTASCRHPSASASSPSTCSSARRARCWSTRASARASPRRCCRTSPRRGSIPRRCAGR